MLAVTFSEFGPPEVLSISDMPMPLPGPGEVVVRVSASTVNPTDLMMRSGKQAHLMTALSPPYIAGMEFSGRVHAVGEGVALPSGHPVLGVVNPRRPEGGAHAEYVCVPAASVVPIADGADIVAAASLPMNALTALMAIEMTGLATGGSLLVTGGTGMLGGSVLQIARHLGLRTVANGSDPALLKELGADFVVPRDEGMEEAVRKLHPSGVDALIDGALIGSRISGLVRDGGTAVSLRMSHPIEDARLRTPYVSVTAGMGRSDLITLVGKFHDEGVLMPRVAENGRVPFRDAVAAHRLAEQGGFRGRIVLVFNDR